MRISWATLGMLLCLSRPVAAWRALPKHILQSTRHKLYRTGHRGQAQRIRLGDLGDGNDGNADQRSLSDRLQELLDSPVIDPMDNGPRDPKPLRAFKELLKTDYQMAEALYAGAYFAVLLAFSQQGVRMYKHCFFSPDSSCPWDVVGDALNF